MKSKSNALNLVSVFIFLLSLGDTLGQEHIPRQPYFKYNLPNKERTDSITFYLSEGAKEKYLPLIIYVQGSGSNSHFALNPLQNIVPQSGHATIYDVAKAKARVLIVEKPGVRYLESNEINPKFDLNFSLESWCTTIEQAIRYVMTHSKIDSSRVLIIGHSEGGLVAAKMANMMGDIITHVAIVAGEGISQLYSLYKFAESGRYFKSANDLKISPIDSLLRAWEKIQSDPLSTSKKFWGFTYLRWSSFLTTSTYDELATCGAQIIIIQGSKDENVIPESAVILFAGLKSKGKEVTLHIIPNADHSFQLLQNESSMDGWEMVARKCINWFLE